MMSLSQTTGYAIKALVCLSEPGCQNSSTSTLAGCSRVPKPYLAKIISSLVQKGLLTSRRGMGGGVALSRSPEEINLLQIVEAVEGPDWLGECLLGFDDCTDQVACPTHDFWERTRKAIIKELSRTNLAMVIALKQNGRGVKRRSAATWSRRNGKQFQRTKNKPIQSN